MIVIPAVDISQGQCVRLRQGDMSRKTVFSRDPVEVAQRWANLGAEIIHVVDLDGAVAGRSENLRVIADIAATVGVPVELGGGLRTAADIARVLDLGVRWAIMGTAAIANRPELEAALSRFEDRIIVGIDARDGRVAVEGWTQTSEVGAVELGREMERLGVGRIIFTDIATDGMLDGPNLDSIRNMAEALQVPVIASGGVTTLDDVRKLCRIEYLGVTGCIIGRALYSGTLDLGEAIAVGREVPPVAPLS